MVRKNLIVISSQKTEALKEYKETKQAEKAIHASFPFPLVSKSDE